MNEIVTRIALEPGCSKEAAIEAIREAADRAAGQIEYSLLPWPLDIVDPTYLVVGEGAGYGATISMTEES